MTASYRRGYIILIKSLPQEEVAMRGAQRVQLAYQRRQQRELQHQNQQPGQDLESQALASKRMPEDKYTALISVSRTKIQEEIIALVRRPHLTMVWQTIRQFLTHAIFHN
jgi:hypothetical protein